MKKLLTLAALLTVVLAFTGCGRSETIAIGATAVPHYEILEYILPSLIEQGFDVELLVFDNFITPNIALNENEIDINFFQHRPFLDNFNEANDASLTPVFGVHFEPLRLYAGRLDTIENIPNGASIAIPEDPTNEARALQLLEALGLITLYDVPMPSATSGIAQNPHNLEIITLTAQIIPSTLPDVDFAIINGNVALQGGVIDRYIPNTAEGVNSPAANNFTNFVVTRADFVNEPVVQALIDLLNSDAVYNFINERYQGRIVPMQIRP